MSSHTVVYLDQNYLSNMAKARLGFLKSKGESDFWLSLFNELKAAVLADRIACPELDLQRDEAEFDTRIEYAVWQVICDLSLGLEFLPWGIVLELQIKDAAFKFLGKNPPQRKSWSLAFKSDPQTTVEKRMSCDAFGIEHQIHVHLFSPSEELLNHDRRLKERWVDEAKASLRQPTFGDWNKRILVQKSAFVNSFLGYDAYNRITEQLASNDLLDKLVANRNIYKLKDRLAQLEKIGITPQNAADFFVSDELLSMPFIDIFCSINAVIVQDYKNRLPRGSDYRDTAIMATVLPYSDVVTTDKFIKYILVERLCFDKKYKCEIFSASKEDRLAFRELVQGLR